MYIDHLEEAQLRRARLQASNPEKYTDEYFRELDKAEFKFLMKILLAPFRMIRYFLSKLFQTMGKKHYH